MKPIWVGATALLLSTAVYASVVHTIVEMPKFDTLALIYKLASPHTLITGTAEPRVVPEAFADYLHLHQTRLENPQHMWLAGQSREAQ